MAFLDQWSLANNEDFRKRIEVAIITAAVDINGETPSGNANIDGKRKALALSIINSPSSYVERFAKSVVTNVAISVSSNDGDIQFTVNSVWNDIAGI